MRQINSLKKFLRISLFLPSIAFFNLIMHYILGDNNEKDFSFIFPLFSYSPTSIG